MKGLRIILKDIDDDGYISLLREGLPFEVAADLVSRMDITQKELARLLNSSVAELRTSHRDGKLTLAQGNRVARLKCLYADIEDLLGDAASSWLRQSLPGLQGRTPLELLDTEPGLTKVLTLTTQLSYGIYA